MQERRKDLAEKLESGLKELYASDKYADYLKTMSKFPHYSSRNVMLIRMQLPGATRVASATKWKRDFKRYPKKGEKAIYIYAPTKRDKEPETKLFEKIDPETGVPMLDKNGKIIMEEMTALDTSGMRYRPVPTFDVSQTDGKPLPEIVSPLNGDVERYEALLDALKAVSALPIEFEKMPESQDGYCRFGEKIGIREGMSQRQTVAAIVHEIAHSRMHGKENIPEGEAQKSRAVRELEAESCAFSICEKYGVNSGANSFGYLASWAGHDPEMKQLKASLDVIQKEVGSLSRELDTHYAQALKKRGLEAELSGDGKDEINIASANGIDSICAKAREYIKENGLFLSFSVDDIKDYQSLRHAAQDVEARGSAHPTAGQNHIRFMYDLLRQAEPFQNEKPLAEKEKSEAPADYLPEWYDYPPDSAITVAEQIEYGYSDYDNMLPLTEQRAIDLFEHGVQVYLLYPDGTEAAADDVNHIKGHDGIFGVESEDWVNSAMFKAEKAKSADKEMTEAPAFETDEYVVTGAGAIISGYGRITGLASDDYPGSNEHFIVDFGSAGTCTVHKNDMTAEIVSGYKIMQRIELSDKEGVALAYSPTAPDPYVTWRYIDRDGERDYHSGQYRQSEESARKELHERADTGSMNQHTSPPEVPAPEPTMSTFPVYKANLADAVDRGETEPYHKSRELNFKCRDTIDRTIEEHRKNIPGAPAGACTYDMKAAVWSVIGECGRERAEWVLAANINSTTHDGRISDANKQWAQNIGAPERHDYHIQSHKTVLDGFIRRFRESGKEKPPMSFLYAQARERKKSAEAGKSGGNVEQSARKKLGER